jgi:hypothetical protein
MQSTKINVRQMGKYQSNTYKVSSKHSLSINTNNYRKVQRKGFSDFNGNKNIDLDTQRIIDTLNLAIRNRNYTLVEYMPETNIIYYDSNLRKYRCYSASLKKPANSFNLNSHNLTNKQNLFQNKISNVNTNIKYNKSFNTTYNNKPNNYTPNTQNQYRINKSSITSKNQIPNINKKYSHSIISNSTINKNPTNIRGNNFQTPSRNDNKNNFNQYRRINSYSNKTEQIKGLNKYNISNNKTDSNNKYNFKNKITNKNQIIDQNKGRNDNNLNLKGNKTEISSNKGNNLNQTNQYRRMNSEEKNNLKNKIPLNNMNNAYQRNQGKKGDEGRKIISNRAQSSNINQINQGRRRNDDATKLSTMNKAQTSNINNNNQGRGRSVGVMPNKSQTNNMGQINQNRRRTEGGKIIDNKTQTNITNQNYQNRRKANEDQNKLLLNRVQNSQGRNTQENKTNIPNLHQNRKIYQEDMPTNNDNSSNIRKDKNQNNNIINNIPVLSSMNNEYTHQTPIPNNRSIQKDFQLLKDTKELSIIDLQQELQKLKSPYKAEEIIKDENGEIVQRKEEKTIAILSGQKIEPKSVIETFEKPTIEIIQNEDGTSQSVIQQKKIITAIENIPIQNGTKNGKDDLQLVKQIITHEYKTISASKDKLDNENNKEINEKNNEENNAEKKSGKK